MNFAPDQMEEPALATQTSCISPISVKLATKRQQLADKLTITTTRTASSEKCQDQSEREDDPQIGDKTCCKENQNIKERYERFCFACERSLAKSRHLINIAGQLHKWHPECFKCQVCNFPLDKETSCHIYKEKIVCKHDYAKLQRDNTTKCARCHWPISALDWVRKAGKFVYHLACFTCDICSRQLSTGEQFTLSIQENTLVRLLCRLHFVIEHNNEHSENNISSDLNKVGSSQQASSKSQQQSPNNTRPSSVNSSSFSASFNHYDRNISKSYSQQTPFVHNSASASYLHMLVASGAAASASTGAGEELKQDQAGASDYNELVTSSGASVDTQLQQQQQLASIHHQHQHNHHHHHHQQQHQEQQQQQRARTSTSTSSNGSTTSANLIGLPSKSKRVRTTFTEDQLSILQTHFQIDSNPDGQDLERIATITGLSKRVTQVWFQNSRARQKKYLIKRKPSSASSSSTTCVANTVAAGTTTAINNTIGLPGNSSSSSAAAAAGIQNLLFQQQQQQQQQPQSQLNSAEELAKVEQCFSNHQYQQHHRDNQLIDQAKWSTVSDDQSNSSLDDASRVIEDEVEGDSHSPRSTDDQLDVSDFDSNEQDH